MKSHHIDNSILKSPCRSCKDRYKDKLTGPCRTCRDRVAYDALLCGVTKEVFESWYEPLPDIDDKIHRCRINGCFRRTKKKGGLCFRCQKNNMNKNLETEKEIKKIEKIMESFNQYCIDNFSSIEDAAKAFGSNKVYLYNIRNFEVYPSRSRASAMKNFVKGEK